MTPIAKIRAALEMARELVPAGFGMPAYANEALAALAELERATAEPVACMDARAFKLLRSRESPWSYEVKTPGNFRDDDVKLYAAPPAPVAEIREVVYATAEMASRVANSYFGTDTPADMSDMMEVLGYWQRELGQALGFVKLKEPTPEECERICTEYERLLMREGTCGGRDAFDAVRAVMWPKEGE